MSDPTERWLPVPEWEGLYEVSDLGRVRSLDRWVPNNTAMRLARGRVLNASIDGSGYFTVALCRGGRSQTHKVHRLILETFAGPCPVGQLGRHGPAGKADNSLSNLCWGTPAENEADKVRDGTNNCAIGEEHGNSKLTEAMVRQMREIWNRGGILQRDLAERFGVTQSQVSVIVRRRQWQHLE